MTDTDIQRDVDHHDPTWCCECNNTGYATEYIDGGRLIAQVPCGCPQTEETDETDDFMENANAWWTTEGWWKEEVRLTLSSKVHVEIICALRERLRHWWKDRNYRHLESHRIYARKRISEIVLALRQINKRKDYIL